MRSYIRNINEITDSREILESRHHPIISLFLVLLALILITFFIWSYFSKTEELVKASGIIHIGENVSMISSPKLGRINEIHIKNGKTVRKGDSVLTLDSEQIDLEIELLEKELNHFTMQQDKLRKMIFLIENNSSKNQFLDEYGEELKIYEISVAQTKLEFGELRSQSSISLEELNKSITTAEKTIQQYEEGNSAIKKEDNSINQLRKEKLLEINQLNELINLIQNDEIDHSNSATFDYSTGINQLKTKEERRDYKEKYLSNLKSMLNVHSLELKNIDETLYQLNDQIIDENQIFDLKKETQKLKENIVSTKQTINQLKDGEKYALSKIMFENLKILKEKDAQLSKEIFTLEYHKKDAELRKKQNTITASVDGTLEFSKQINNGDFLQAGEGIFNITPQSDSFVVKINIANNDILKIKKGNQVLLHIDALPYKQYGESTAVVEQINRTPYYDEKSKKSYYEVLAKVSPLELTNKLNLHLEQGMMTEVFFITGKEKILNNLLEKLNFR